MAKIHDVSELSDFPSGLANGPESRHVVAGVDALLEGDILRARFALIEAAEVAGWTAVAHRLDVAGRALAADAGIGVDGPGLVDALPELIGCAWVDAAGVADVSAVLATWVEGETIELASMWAAMRALGWLVQRAGFPAAVVV